MGEFILRLWVKSAHKGKVFHKIYAVKLDLHFPACIQLTGAIWGRGEGESLKQMLRSRELYRGDKKNETWAAVCS